MVCGAKEVETWEKKKDGDDQRDFGVGVLVSVMVEWKKGDAMQACCRITAALHNAFVHCAACCAFERDLTDFFSPFEERFSLLLTELVPREAKGLAQLCCIG